MTTRLRHRPRTELTADEKARLRKVYVDSDMPVDTIRQRFGLAARTIASIARREGWPVRKGRWELASSKGQDNGNEEQPRQF